MLFRLLNQVETETEDKWEQNGWSPEDFLIVKRVMINNMTCAMTCAMTNTVLVASVVESLVSHREKWI